MKIFIHIADMVMIDPISRTISGVNSTGNCSSLVISLILWGAKLLTSMWVIDFVVIIYYIVKVHNIFLGFLEHLANM